MTCRAHAAVQARGVETSIRRLKLLPGTALDRWRPAVRQLPSAAPAIGRFLLAMATTMAWRSAGAPISFGSTLAFRHELLLLTTLLRGEGAYLSLPGCRTRYMPGPDRARQLAMAGSPALAVTA